MVSTWQSQTFSSFSWKHYQRKQKKNAGYTTSRALWVARLITVLFPVFLTYDQIFQIPEAGKHYMQDENHSW
jgi:hypothetical protein